MGQKTNRKRLKETAIASQILLRLVYIQLTLELRWFFRETPNCLQITFFQGKIQALKYTRSPINWVEIIYL